ncbi:MAG: hypothetical protein HKN21_03280 [Candidatus Eisenbacteria bacterium]|uniref:histidine kinase n=1 Tax=Eiseniibacteriota bacterium TaxID=2212470 RepID=A0A7Y2E997_UNCEI|nr:hypothetical protein [Candidatus Eisenbacteria bacterium]
MLPTPASQIQTVDRRELIAQNRKMRLFSRGVALCILAVAALIGPPTIQAQEKIHRSLSVEDGLVQSQINAIFQDKDGFVWLGTFGGASRWSGSRFENFQAQHGLESHDVRAIVQLPNHDLIFATHDRGLFRRRDGVISSVSVESLPSLSANTALVDDANGLWVGTSAGLVRFSVQDTAFASPQVFLEDIDIVQVVENPFGGVFVLARREGIFHIDTEGTEELRIAADRLPESRWRTIFLNGEDDLLISVHKHGLWRANGDELDRYLPTRLPSNHDVMRIVRARNGDMYFGTAGGGVLVLRGDTVEALTPENGLAGDVCWAILELEPGLFLLGCWGGLSIYEPGRFINYNETHGLDPPIVLSSAQTTSGRTYLGTPRGLFEVRGEEVTRVLPAENALKTSIWSLHPLGGDRLLVGSRSGLYEYADNRLRGLFGVGDQTEGRIYAIERAPNGDLYLGTFAGLFKFSDGVGTKIPLGKDLTYPMVYDVFLDEQHTLHAATRLGVFELVDDIETNHHLPGIFVWSIHRNQQGKMFYGTNENGLYMRSEAKWDSVTVGFGLVDNTVYQVLEDRNGKMYLPSHRGVHVLEADYQPGDPVQVLDRNDGLASIECNQGASRRAEDGRLWFGTLKGVSIYDPSRENETSPFLRTNLKEVKLYEAPLPLTKTPLDLAHNENYLRFEYEAVHFRAPHRLQYRYRMSNLDKDWVVSRVPQVQYTALPAGNYTFEMAAGTGLGGWSEQESLQFTVGTPWWKTWWFISALILLILAAAWTVVRARVAQLLQIERLRTRIAADLHDDIGAGLTEIGILGSMIEHKLPKETRPLVEGELKGIGETSRSLIGGMRDIVWLIKPKQDSLFDLMVHLVDTSRQPLEGAGIEIRSQGMESLRATRLPMEKRQQVLMICKEAIHNVLKHSEATYLKVTAKGNASGSEISFEDNGAGFNLQSLTRGNGLTNMKRRAKEANVSVSIDSKPGQGTIIKLAI